MNLFCMNKNRIYFWRNPPPKKHTHAQQLNFTEKTVTFWKWWDCFVKIFVLTKIWNPNNYYLDGFPYKT